MVFFHNNIFCCLVLLYSILGTHKEDLFRITFGYKDVVCMLIGALIGAYLFCKLRD